MLPALPEDVTGALPALDQEHLAAFDEQISVLVETVREKGFSESTVLSILAARKRLYAERGAAWRHLVLYGEPLSSVERLAGDESAGRAWVRDRLWAAVSDHVADTVRTGRQGGRHQSHGSLPHFQAWFVDRDVSDETPDHVLIEAHWQYAAWLDEQGDAVLAEAADLMAREPQGSLKESVFSAARIAVADFHALVFSEFDEMFMSHIRRGITQVRDAPPMPAMATDSRGLFQRLVDRMLHEVPTVMEDRKSLEYRALSDFFNVGKALSDMVTALEEAPEVTQIVDEFKRVTGLDAWEAAVLGTAKTRLAALVNRETAFAFLSRFDHDVRRQSAGRAGEPAGDHSTTSDEGGRQAATGPNPVTFAMGANRSTVAFTRAALTDEVWARVLYEKIAEMLESQISHHALSPEFIETLCRESSEALTPPDKDEGETSLDKRVLRRLALAFHPDTRLADDKRGDTDEMNARTLGRLLDLHRSGRFEIRATDGTVTILTRS